MILPSRTPGLGSTSYASQVQALAPQYGIPPSLAVAVMNAESSGNPNAVSPAGAIGLFQLMPATAASLGVNPNDPTQNIQGGLQYLQQMYQQFGNWPDALAAYNEGPGAFQKSGAYPSSAAYASGILSAAGLDSSDYSPVDDSGGLDLPDDPGSSSGLSSGAAIAIGAGILGLAWAMSN